MGNNSNNDLDIAILSAAVTTNGISIQKLADVVVQMVDIVKLQESRILMLEQLLIGDNH